MSIAFIVLTLASTPIALASTLNYEVTFEVNASGPCFAASYLMNKTGGIEEVYYAEVGAGYVTMIGEALAKGPIPYAFPGSNPFEYPTDPKTGTPIHPLAYGYDAGNVDGIGSIFGHWTVNSVEEHKLLLTLQTIPEPEFGVPVPFAGVVYPEGDGLWVPTRYEGRDQSYQSLSGDTVFVCLTSGLSPYIPEGLSGIMFGMYVDAGENRTTVSGLTWVKRPTNTNVINPSLPPDKEIPAATVFDIKVELQQAQSFTFSYTSLVGVVGVAMIAVIGVVAIKRRRVNL